MSKDQYDGNHSFFALFKTNGFGGSWVNEPCHQERVQEYKSFFNRLSEVDLKHLGFHVFDDFCTHEESTQLQQCIERDLVLSPAFSEMHQDKERRGMRCNLGFLYSKEKGKRYQADFSSNVSIPKEIQMLGNKILDFLNLHQATILPYTKTKKIPETWNQVYIQTYEGKDGLAPHYDNRENTEEIIVGISLSGTSEFYLSTDPGSMKASSLKPTAKRRRIILKRNQMYIMSGVSRFILRHAVKHSQEDQKRTSITFRCLRIKNAAKKVKAIR